MKQDRRPILAKEKFLEGNRQRFTLILLTSAAAIMTCQVAWHIDPAPYLNFLTFIGSFYLGGATVSDYVKANKVSTMTTNTTVVTDTREEVHSKDEHVSDTNVNETKLLQLERVDPKDVDEEAFTE